MSRREWITEICNFCGQKLADDFMAECECLEFQQAMAKKMEAIKNDLDYEEPLTPEEYEKKYPIICKQWEKTNDGRGMAVVVQKWDDGIGISLINTFEGKEDYSGLAWDVAEEDLGMLIMTLDGIEAEIAKWKKKNSE